MPLLSSDYSEGILNQDSNIRANRLFIADEKLILYKAGHVNSEKYIQVAERLIELIK